MRVKLLLEAIITYDVAIEFSWTGMSTIGACAEKTKRSVNTMTAFRDLMVRCMGVRGYGEVVPDSVDKDIQNFFRRANANRKLKIATN